MGDAPFWPKADGSGAHDVRRRMMLSYVITAFRASDAVFQTSLQLMFYVGHGGSFSLVILDGDGGSVCFAPTGVADSRVERVVNQEERYESLQEWVLVGTFATVDETILYMINMLDRGTEREKQLAKVLAYLVDEVRSA
jgi:hypothetical protein